MLFFIATGHYPFENGEPLQIAMRHVMETPPLVFGTTTGTATCSSTGGTLSVTPTTPTTICCTP